MLLDAPVVSEAGTIERLIHEVEFDLDVASHSQLKEFGCPFEITQFQRAVADGTYSILNDLLRAKLRSAYRYMSRANTFIAGLASTTPEEKGGATASNRAQNAVAESLGPIKEAFEALCSKT